MNITHEKAFLLSLKKEEYTLDKEPGSSISFIKHPDVINILLLINSNTIVLQVVISQRSNVFIDWNRKGSDFSELEVSKEEFFSLLKSYPAHFEWFLFNF